MLSAVFEPAIPSSEPPQTHALDRSAIEIESFRQLVLSCVGNKLLVIIPDCNKFLFNRLVLNNSDILKTKRGRRKSAAGVRAMKNVLPYIYFRVPCNSLRHRLMESCAVTTWSYPVLLVSLFFFSAVIQWLPSVRFLSFGTDEGATGPVANYALLALPPVCLSVPAEASTWLLRICSTRDPTFNNILFIVSNSWWTHF